MTTFADATRQGIPASIPEMPPEEPGISHAPARPGVLDRRGRELALTNALRYFPAEWHGRLALEFARELAVDGRIYMRRFRPSYEMKARPMGIIRRSAARPRQSC